MVKALIKREEVRGIAKEILANLKAHENRAALITLAGDLGAGKTTFVQVLARELGVEMAVQSPTYVIMKKYDTAHPHFSTLVHIDLYRLEKPEDLAPLRLEAVLKDPRVLVAIEWPERAGTLLPTPDVALTFSSEGAGEGERYIEV